PQLTLTRLLPYTTLFRSTVIRHAIPNTGYLVTGAIFSRDCLEVDLAVGGKTLTLLINHFKAQDGRKASDTRRTEQAQRVAELVKDRKSTRLNSSPEWNSY